MQIQNTNTQIQIETGWQLHIGHWTSLPGASLVQTLNTYKKGLKIQKNKKYRINIHKQKKNSVRLTTWPGIGLPFLAPVLC